MAKRVLTLLMVSVVSLFSLVVEAAERQLNVGIFPRENPAALYAAFKPMAEYLEARLGMKVNLVLSKDYEAFKSSLKSGELDVVHMNHNQYISVRKDPGYRVFVVNKEAGSEKMKAAIFVRTDSPIRKLSELKGKTFIFAGNKDGFFSYVLPAKMLIDGGIEPSEYTAQFAINTPNGLIALSRGEGDAAVAAESLLQRPYLKSQGVDKKLRVLATSEQFPGLPWATKKGMESALSEKVKKAFLSLNDSAEGKKILEKANIDGFAEADDGDFESAMKAIQFMKKYK